MRRHSTDKRLTEPNQEPSGQPIFSVASLLLLVIIFISTAACTSPGTGKGSAESTRLIGSYLAHVQLEETQLVATEVVNGLEAPRDITLDPEGWIWVNEVSGSLYRANPVTGEKIKVLDVPDVYFERARGLLSTALHPEFPDEPYVYLHYTFEPSELGSRIVRYTFTGDTLVEPETILDRLPGGSGHSGSKMMAGPDGKLWLATGDASREDLAQDLDVYHGKILRMNPDGSVPEDNPFERSHIWTSGHRNMQGLTYGNGHIYASEHGPANDDEVNLLLKGRNYGYPDVMGYCDSELEKQYCEEHDIVEPIIAFNPVVAASGLAYYGHDAIPEWTNSLLLASLRIQTLRVLHLDEPGESVEDVQIFFQQQFGRIRDVIVDPEGRIYLMTSSTDWYRESRADIHDPAHVVNGDRIILLQAADESLLASLEDIENRRVMVEDRVPLYLGSSEIADNLGASERLYLTHCGSCHLQDGTGMEGTVPPLAGSESVGGDRRSLIDLLLYGVPAEQQSGEYDWNMPGFQNLENDEIAAILNYIRGNFSTESDYFTAEDVQEVRESS